MKKTTPALMLQGTCSDAGKSILAAAFCRIFLQDGLRVAPFKAQNMSLNSFVTRDGGEMGRAQVVQAQACLLDADVRMNPILIKPNSDTGSQIIVNGKPIGNLSVEKYYAYKDTARQAAQAAYDSLAAEFDLMVLEGAGSPAEVNLKKNDIVNMNMARYAQAKVLIVGDIDRGGVFASLVGTMELFEEWEKELVAGFIINKFRGLKSLLDPALDFTLQKTGRPILGVVDYLPGLGLPEEDSVGFKKGLFNAPAPTGKHVKIGLIDLPHISNFTDFEPFLNEPDVHLETINTPAGLGEFDAIILPGSKNVINDLNWLRETGLFTAIKTVSERKQMTITGICGGFQMLGHEISDPHHLESTGETVMALGLIDMQTVLEEDKTLTRRTGTHLPSALTIHGYEIHHGQTSGTDFAPVHDLAGADSGAAVANNRIWGSYLHGIFDADDFRRWFIDQLRLGKNIPALKKVQAAYDLEPAFDRLAAHVREEIDMDHIYKVLGL